MINRKLRQIIEQRLFRGKIIVLTGPRQVGKTTLLKMLMSDMSKKTLFWNCDEPDIRQKLSNPTSTQLGTDIGNSELILIDEAQRVKNIGIDRKSVV